MEALPVILVHGAWQGAWVWARFAPLLAAAGFAPVAIDLPGNGTDDTPPEAVDLALYVQHVIGIIKRHGSVVALIGHSGGGAVISQVAEALPDHVKGLVYVAGMMLPDGIGYGDLVREALPEHPQAPGISPYLVWSADGSTSSVPPEAGANLFLNDMDRDEALELAGRLTPQPEGGRAVAPRITAERFGRVPRLYVEATNDRSVFVFLQRRMQQLVPGAEIATLHTGHAPHVSAPEALAVPVIDFLRRLPQTQSPSERK